MSSLDLPNLLYRLTLLHVVQFVKIVVRQLVVTAVVEELQLI